MSIDLELIYEEECAKVNVTPDPTEWQKLHMMRIDEATVEPDDELRHKLALLRTHIRLLEYLRGKT